LNSGTDDSDDVYTRATAARELGDDPDYGFAMDAVALASDTAVSLPAAVPAAPSGSPAGSEKEKEMCTQIS